MILTGHVTAHRRPRYWAEPDSCQIGSPVNRTPREEQDEAAVLRRAVDMVPAMVGYWDTELRNRMGNAAYVSFFGLTPDQMRGRHIRDVIGEELYEQNLPYMQAALAGHPQHFDREIVDPQGNRRYTQASYLPDIDDTGQVLGFSVLVADVTPRVQAEQALAAEQLRVARLTNKLRIVGTLSASLRQDDADAVQDSVGDAVLALGFDGAIVVLRDDEGTLRPRHGRGIFARLDGARIAQKSTISSEVMRDGRLRFIPDYQVFDGALPEVRATGVRGVAAVPIVSGPQVLGVLQAGRLTPEPLSEEDSEALSLLAAVAGTTLRYAQSFLDLRRSERRLTAEVTKDPLTGLGNRRAADEALASVRPGDAVVMLDLDRFKGVNDTHGHATGDVVLRHLGRMLLDRLRKRDQAMRIGGEEFLLLLPSSTAHVAVGLVERLRQQWAAEQSWTSFSAGVAVVAADEVGAEAQRRADLALYRAKRSGRDQVCLAGRLEAVVNRVSSE